MDFGHRKQEMPCASRICATFVMTASRFDFETLDNSSETHTSCSVTAESVCASASSGIVRLWYYVKKKYKLNVDFFG